MVICRACPASLRCCCCSLRCSGSIGSRSTTHATATSFVATLRFVAALAPARSTVARREMRTLAPASPNRRLHLVHSRRASRRGPLCAHRQRRSSPRFPARAASRQGRPTPSCMAGARRQGQSPPSRARLPRRHCNAAPAQRQRQSSRSPRAPRSQHAPHRSLWPPCSLSTCRARCPAPLALQTRCRPAECRRTPLRWRLVHGAPQRCCYRCRLL